MTYLYIVVIVFSLLTIVLSYEEYRKNKLSRRFFITTTVLKRRWPY